MSLLLSKQVTIRLSPKLTWQLRTQFYCRYEPTTAEILKDKCKSNPNLNDNAVYKTPTTHSDASEKCSKIVGTCDNFRFNEMNIQMLSRSLYDQLFAKLTHPASNPTLIKCAKDELKKHGLPGALQRLPDVDLLLPEIFKGDLEEHFLELGRKQSGPYKNLVDKLVSSIPEIPERWEMIPGWTRYCKGEAPVHVDFPAEEAMIFDVEVCVLEGENPVIATAASNTSWYLWVSEELCNDSKKMRKRNFYNYTTRELIPLESNAKQKCFHLPNQLLQPKVVVGHHVSYDRARIKEQYWINRTGARFVDTMSLHICICGVTSEQKIALKTGGAKYESWSERTSLNNSLKEVYKFYCDAELPKEERDIFTTGSLQDVRKNFQSLASYCARDAEATHQVLTHVWPEFLERFPHPVTFAGMLELSTCYLPTNNNWRRYLQDSQDTFDDLNIEAKFLLSQQADRHCQLLHGEKYKQDLWLWDQDWTLKPLKLKKLKKPTKKELAQRAAIAEAKITEEKFTLTSDYESNEFDCGKLKKLEMNFGELLESDKRLPAKTPHLAGYPEWYRAICEPSKTDDWKPGPNLVTTSLKCVPKLLTLTWNYMPLHHLRSFGWCYFVPYRTNIHLPPEQLELFPFRQFITHCVNVKDKCGSLMRNLKIDDLNEYFQNLLKSGKSAYEVDFGLAKLPHKNGDDLNVGNPLSRDFINKFSDVEISSSNENTRRIIEINRQLTYWKNNKDRIENQMVVWLCEYEKPWHLHGASHNIGVILPQVVVSGTLTRRAVESTWMTASNADFEKVGSELRCMIQAPVGYSIVGADVDSQELWIASLIGDAYYSREHGSTAFSWMTLSGQKADGTDMHSVTAKTMGISRSNAKIINYARIYGAGATFTEHLLKQFVPGLRDSEANNKTRLMFQTTKGKRLFRLKDNVLPEVELREYGRFTAKKLCSAYSKDVDELFERPKWSGGSESAMFNSLEEIACSEQPRTPFLGARLSRAVEPDSSDDTRRMPTRINWVVQSSAVDFLHLMLVCMRWLIDPEIRFCLSFHDEVRYLVPDKSRYETALALHVTNLLVRCFFVQRLGMRDLPQSVAFFSSVDVDQVLRKETFVDCVTPSNPYGLSKGYGIPAGESLDVIAAIKKAEGRIGVRKVKKKDKPSE